jgi:hypothetical protein
MVPIQICEINLVSIEGGIRMCSECAEEEIRNKRFQRSRAEINPLVGSNRCKIWTINFIDKHTFLNKKWRMHSHVPSSHLHLLHETKHSQQPQQ